MTIGAANDKELALSYRKIIGENAKNNGIHWIFAPVVDLNMSAESPVTNVRSLSDDVERAIPLAKQIVKGIQMSGVAATVKHFPGTDYKECIDLHIAPFNNMISKEK